MRYLLFALYIVAKQKKHSIMWTLSTGEKAKDCSVQGMEYWSFCIALQVDDSLITLLSLS